VVAGNLDFCRRPCEIGGFPPLRNERRKDGARRVEVNWLRKQSPRLRLKDAALGMTTLGEWREEQRQRGKNTVDAMTQKQALGLYVSVPFAVEVHVLQLRFRSVSGERTCALRGPADMKTLRRRRHGLAHMGVELPRAVDTIYLGGGTPSPACAGLIAELFGAMRNEFALTPDAEITVECAPGQIASPRWRRWQRRA